MRRKRWEYRQQAVSVVNAYGEAINAGKSSLPHSGGVSDAVRAAQEQRAAGVPGLFDLVEQLGVGKKIPPPKGKKH